jgi:hypothetical protein
MAPQADFEAAGQHADGTRIGGLVRAISNALGGRGGLLFELVDRRHRGSQLTPRLLLELSTQANQRLQPKAKATHASAIGHAMADS